MGTRGWWLSAAAASAIALAVVLAVSALGTDEPGPGNDLVAGQIYSTGDGDPIDLRYGPGEPGMGCMTNVGGGINYSGSHMSCFDLDEVDLGGWYQLILARYAEDPAIVVGVMPVGATGARVSGVGRKTARAETRGRWFLASLEPTDPSVSDLATLRVAFDY